MFFGRVRLRVRRPSPTTVEFIVSGRPDRHSLTTHLTGALVVLARLALAGLMMVLVLAKWKGHPHIPIQTQELPIHARAWTLAARQPLWKVATLVLASSHLIVRRRYRGRVGLSSSLGPG